jgi:prepilin-type N-terminal cleavage/methylation domain-containing protein
MKKINSKGFSLLEVMLALGVITIGLMGVSSLVLQNIQAQDINKNYLIASMLAQEGIELVRNIRDTNFLLGNDWKSGKVGLPNTNIIRGASIGESRNYVIDYNKDITNVSGMNDPITELFINSVSKVYEHNSAGLPTIYHRLITTYNFGEYVEVHSNVQWIEQNRTHNYEAVTDLYNWW